MIRYSFIVPVYNRPEEIKELLESFRKEDARNFEIIIVEDGSSIDSKEVIKGFEDLPVEYIYQENTGPGPARNLGASSAKGEWLIFLDSDTLLGEGYINSLDEALSDEKIDCFGGPDATHPDFTDIQKAIGYSMTAFLSTGGIRGSKRSLEKFKPRSFNMGIKKAAFEEVGGFSSLRFGEDMDLSMRIEEKSFTSTLIEGAFVYHKRRARFRQFYKQVFNSGMARIVLSTLHPGSHKLVHLLPLAFVFYHFLLLGMGLMVGPLLYMALLVYPILFLAVSILVNRSLIVGLLSVGAVYVQLFGYGAGYLKAAFTQYVLRRPISYAFRDNFYD